MKPFYHALCVCVTFLRKLMLTHRRDGNENRAEISLRQDRDRRRDGEEDDEPYGARFDSEYPRLDKKPHEAC